MGPEPRVAACKAQSPPPNQPDQLSALSDHFAGETSSSEAGSSPQYSDSDGLIWLHGPVRREVSLRILATSDVHANVMSYDYAANKPLNGQGLAQLSILIEAARAEAPEALLLDNGDFLQGTALADHAARPMRRRGHPVISAMNALGYDAACLGNHEFNFGLEVLRRALAEAAFPAVSANVLLRRGRSGPLEDETLVAPYVILDRDLPDASGRLQRLRIGVLGLTPPEILRWDHLHLAGQVEVRLMVETAKARVPELRRAGADLVICLAHTGIADRLDGRGREGSGADLAEIPGIDAMVLGHSHLTFPNRGFHLDPRVDPASGRIAGIPVVQPGYFGSHLGIIDLKLGQDPLGRWNVTGAEVQARSVSELLAGLPTPEIRRRTSPLRQAVDTDHRAALAWTRQHLGQTEVPLSTTFSQVVDTAPMRLVGLAKIERIRHALRGTEYESLPVIASASPFRTGGAGGPLNYTDIPPGPLSIRHVFDLYPFPNRLIGLLVTGACLREDLERSAGIYAQIMPGQRDQLLIDPSFPSYAFTSIIGLSYRIDLTQPARYDQRGRLIRPLAQRVQNLRRGGMRVRDQDLFVLATNSFRASGALGGEPARDNQILADGEGLCSDRLLDFITKTKVIQPATLAMPERWHLGNVPGTSVLIEAGPTAMRHIEEAAHLEPELAGLSAKGFHLLRLQL